MKVLRIIIEILMLLLIIAFIVKDCHHGVVCEGVYIESDSTYVSTNKIVLNED